MFKNTQVSVLTTAQRDRIILKKEGMLIYNTTVSSFQLYSGSTWSNVSDAVPGPSYDTQQINIPWVDGMVGTALWTGKALLTKIGNIVTMQLEPVGGVLGDQNRSAGTTYVETWADTIPVGWRPQMLIATELPMTDNGTHLRALLRVNNAYLSISKDATFEANPFTGPLSGFVTTTLSWNVDPLT